jgi:hypothetical protein
MTFQLRSVLPERRTVIEDKKRHRGWLSFSRADLGLKAVAAAPIRGQQIGQIES